MKLVTLLSMSCITISLLSSCAAHNSAETPSLAPNTSPTSRLPSPENHHANALMQGSTMSVPVRP